MRCTYCGASGRFSPLGPLEMALAKRVEHERAERPDNGRCPYPRPRRATSGASHLVSDQHRGNHNKDDQNPHGARIARPSEPASRATARIDTEPRARRIGRATDAGCQTGHRSQPHALSVVRIMLKSCR
jgi:hypothetical protein